jgi:hypothetical protein
MSKDRKQVLDIRTKEQNKKEINKLKFNNLKLKKGN